MAARGRVDDIVATRGGADNSVAARGGVNIEGRHNEATRLGI